MEKVWDTSLFGWRHWQLLQEMLTGSKKVINFDFLKKFAQMAYAEL